MKTKTGRVLAVAILLAVALLQAFTYEYLAAAAWGSLALAMALSGERLPAGQRTPKTPKQYLMAFCLVLALGLFGYQLYRDLTDKGASRLPSTTPVHE
ncbi:hypothetical protein [Rufibacter latericius]|uniref:Uncharacterized protein n=1 Tax=Rufibacter latericius TaxID=2487040 RepID=A0A3M9MMW5_9BACT|nr:hypothetical protein [Rufibacter latericius]RNI26886.1 hypothetical protein EFB08_10435 [Rufibacter latericius]